MLPCEFVVPLCLALGAAIIIQKYQSDRRIANLEVAMEQLLDVILADLDQTPPNQG